MLSFSHRRKISLPPLSLSLAIILSFFFPPIFSHVHSSLTGVLVRASVFPIDEERTRETGVEREDCVRERKREGGERSWFVKFAHLFVYRHTIELKLGRVRMNAWTPAAYVRRYAWTSSLIHNPSKGLMELRGSYTARTISIPLSLSVSLFFCLYFSRFFFFVFQTPICSPLVFTYEAGGVDSAFLWNASFVARHCAILNNLARLSAPMQV